METRNHRFLILTGCVWVSLVHGTWAQPYTDVYIFGESLADTGNLKALFAPYGRDIPPSPPYAGGRWSNGKVYVEVVADNLDLGEVRASENGGNNYAYGGARSTEYSYVGGMQIPSVRHQVEAFLNDVGGIADPNALYIIQIGGNDTMAAFGVLVQQGWDAGFEVAENAALGVVNSVELLKNHGAAHFVVPGTHLFSVQPMFCGIPEIDSLAEVFNTTLEEGLTNIEGDMSIVYFNSLEFEMTMKDHFISCTPCVQFSDPGSVCDNPDDLRNWDNMGHISAAANQTIGDALTIAILKHKIMELTVGEKLSAGRANSLLSKLEEVFTKLENRAIRPATKKLHAFVNQVEAFVRVGILSTEEAELLLVGAMGVIEQP